MVAGQVQHHEHAMAAALPAQAGETMGGLGVNAAAGVRVAVRQ